MKNSSIPNLSLGTANFGMVYGVGSNGKKMERLQVSRIITMANKQGFTHLDTASSYGNAEEILGDLLPESNSWLLTTKLRQCESTDARSIIQAVKMSLRRTKQKKFWSVLLHDAKSLFGDNSNEVQQGLAEILDLGLTQHVGISAYSELEIVQAKNVAPFLKVFQIPENVCDQRLTLSSNLSGLASENNYFFVRSIFLQGLLLLDSDSLPKQVASAAPILQELKVFCEDLNVTILELCIGYARSLTWSSGLIFGANSENHVLDISNALNSVIDIDYSRAPKLSPWFLDPRNWS